MFGGPTDEGNPFRIIARAIDEGINFIDMANIYNNGEAERILGKAIQGKRDRAVIATKVRGAMGEGGNDEDLSRWAGPLSGQARGPKSAEPPTLP